MKTSLEQQVSELIDGELDAPERQNLLNNLKKDSRLLNTWGRYHLISDALKSNLPDFVSHDLSRRIKAAIELEPTLLVPTPISLDEPQSPAASRDKVLPKYQIPLAVAASLGAVAVLGVTLTQLTSHNASPDQTIAAVPANPFPVDAKQVQQRTAAVAMAPVVEQEVASAQNPPSFLAQQGQGGSAWLRIDTSGRSELNNYLLDHSEYSASAGVRGIIPYARVVSYEVNGFE